MSLQCLIWVFQFFLPFLFTLYAKVNLLCVDKFL